MKFENLKNFDSSLKLLNSKVSKNSLEVRGLSDFYLVEENKALFIRDRKYLARFFELDNTESLGLILSEKLDALLDGKERENLYKKSSFVSTVEDVALGMSYLSEPFYYRGKERWNDEVDSRQMGTAEIDPSAYIAQGVFLGANVKIGTNAKIHSGAVILSDSEVGENTEIFPNVTVYQNCKIGKNTRIHSGSVIGADGFGYNFKDGKHYKVWHIGGVVIGDDVEVGANSCIDQGTFSPTIIANQVKLDNHVQIGHNCRLGTGVIICGHVALGGSTVIGDFTVFGGKSGSGDNLELGPACQVAGGALVNANWPAKTTLGGHPARPLKEWMKGLAYLRKMSLKKNESVGD